jgi:CBS domain-containing protein
MRVADLMQTNLKTVRGEDTVGDAIALLAESHVSGLPVVDDRGRLLGVLSNSDILQALSERDAALPIEMLFDETLIRDIMTPRPETTAPDATLKEVAQRLLYLEIHRLFVECEGRLIGIVSTTDLVRALAGMARA